MLKAHTKIRQADGDLNSDSVWDTNWDVGMPISRLKVDGRRGTGNGETRIICGGVSHKNVLISKMK